MDEVKPISEMSPHELADEIEEMLDEGRAANLCNWDITILGKIKDALRRMPNYA